MRAKSYLGPYELLGEFVPKETFNEEDPCIWRDHRGHFHALFHFTHGHGWSADGISWKWGGGNAAWSSSLKKADGSVEQLKDSERPRVWVNPATKMPELLFVASGGASQPTKPGQRGFTVVQQIRTEKPQQLPRTKEHGVCSGKCASLAPCASADKWTDNVVPGKYTLVGQGDKKCLDVDAKVLPGAPLRLLLAAYY